MPEQAQDRTRAASPRQSPIGLQKAMLSQEIVRIYAETLGRRPTKAGSEITDDHALCVLERALTRAECSLAASGRLRGVREQRQSLSDVMRGDLLAAVERVTGRAVRCALSQVDPEEGIVAELFLFRRPEDRPEHPPAPAAQQGP